MKRTRNRLVLALGAAAAVLLLVLPANAQPKGKKEFAFRGKVEKIDLKTKTLTVNGENVQGWMPAMTMPFSVDKEDVITHLKVGDEITAKVYEGDLKTLYEVQVVPPKGKAAPAPSKK